MLSLTRFLSPPTLNSLVTVRQSTVMLRSLLRTTTTTTSTRRLYHTAMKIVPVPVRSDNYAYLLISSTRKALVVDPYDVSKVLSAIEKEGLKEEDIEGVLTTHHHEGMYVLQTILKCALIKDSCSDHAGGNSEFKKRIPNAKIYGGSSRVQALTHTLKDSDTLSLGQDVSIKCLATPCHTQDSICYHITSPSSSAGAVFTGDTLFIGGCGRFFEGTPKEMATSLSYLATLPASTVVYGGHEYTAGNISFAKSILGPSDPSIQRLEGLLNEPEGVVGRSTIGDEAKWNVFWPAFYEGDERIKKATGLEDKDAIMGALREMKNGFRG